jgi:hypothetical protein
MEDSTSWSSSLWHSEEDNDSSFGIEDPFALAKSFRARRYPSDEDEAPYESFSVAENDRVVIEDWSQTGKGARVDFDDRASVPLIQDTLMSFLRKRQLELIRTDSRPVSWPRCYRRRS